jgi:hypothetical protein
MPYRPAYIERERKAGYLGWADLIHQHAVKHAGHAALIGRIRSEEMYVQVLSAFQATPRKTIIAESSIHTIKPIAAASPP